MSKPILKYTIEKRERTSMYASDAGKLAVDVILELQKVEQTNPANWNDTLKWEAGKSIELQLIKVLKENKVIDPDYDQEKEEATQIERLGVPIRMRFDAKVIGGGAQLAMEEWDVPTGQRMQELGEGEPIEVKSINNANKFDIQKYIESNPRENYVQQLSIYMDALNKDRGHLMVSSIDGLHFFYFTCNKVGDGIYECGKTRVDLNEVYAKFKEIWDNKDKEPNWGEIRYKLPIDEIDWTKLSTTAIGDVRNGRKVVGDIDQWKLLYSPYLNLILEKQNVKRGYNDSELEMIKELTKGFSSKKGKENA